MSRRNGESEYTQSLKEFCFKGGQRNRGVAGKGYESRDFIVFYFKVGEIMACLCTIGKKEGKLIMQVGETVAGKRSLVSEGR